MDLGSIIVVWASYRSEVAIVAWAILLISAFISFLKLDVFFQEQLLESESGLTELECDTILSFGDGIANIFG